MQRVILILALVLAAAPAFALTDNFGRTVTVVGNSYSVPGIMVTEPDATTALSVLNAMAPADWMPPAAAPQTTISSLDFIRRFTMAEQTALQQANPLWGLQIAAAGTINVNDATLLADMAQAVAAGLLTQARMDQVLNLAIASP